MFMMTTMHETKLRAVDLNLLPVLAALLEHRNVTRAAAAAGLSQPAMSRALGRLRELLDDPLLARGERGLILTPRASALQPVLARVLADAAGLIAPERFEPSRWRGRVRIAATDHQTLLIMPTVMTRLAREAPGLDVSVVSLQRDRVGALVDGRIDLAFGITQEATAGLKVEPLFADRFVSLLRAGHPALEDWTVERFTTLDHVLVTVLDDGRGVIDDTLDAMGLRRRIALRLPHFYAAMATVAETDMVVSLPASLASRQADRFGLQMREPPIATGSFTIALLWGDVLDADPARRWLRDLIRDAALSTARPPAR